MSRRVAIGVVALLCAWASTEDTSGRQGAGRHLPDGLPGGRPVRQPCANGTPTDVLHAYSECNPNDRMWHVVTDQEYMCRLPDGTTVSQTVRVSDQPTDQRCDDEKIDPNAPPRRRALRVGDLPQMEFDDKALPTGGLRTFRECINSFWANVTYELYRAADGRLVIDRQRPRQIQTTTDPCTEPPPPPARRILRDVIIMPGLLDRRTSMSPSGAGPSFALEPRTAINVGALADGLNTMAIANSLVSPAQRITVSETADSLFEAVPRDVLIDVMAPIAARRGPESAIARLIALARPVVVHADANPVQLLFATRGGSTGDILEMQVFRDGGEAAALRLEGLDVVLEPLKEDAARQIRAALQKRGARAIRSVRLNGYCLEFLKTPPTAGSVFRIAPPAVQAQFAKARTLLDASRRLQAAGVLKPDTDPANYLHAVRQWAIWADEQQLDEAAFTARFVEHTRKNVVASGRSWTKTLETAVRQTAPNRWRDVSRIRQTARLTGAR